MAAEVGFGPPKSPFIHVAMELHSLCIEGSASSDLDIGRAKMAQLFSQGASTFKRVPRCRLWRLIIA